MNKPLDPAATVTRAEVEDFLYHEADLLDAWRHFIVNPVEIAALVRFTNQLGVTALETVT